MAKTRHLSLDTYPPGTTSFGPWVFPNGMAGFSIRIGRRTTADPSIWSNKNSIIRVDMQFSWNGGVTYSEIGTNYWSSEGGVLMRGGEELAEDAVSWRFHPDEPTHAKGLVTVSGGAVRTYLDVEIS